MGFKPARLLVLFAAVSVVVGLFAGVAPAAPKGAPQRYLVSVRSAADYDAVRAKVVASGGQILRDVRQVNMMVVSSDGAVRSQVSRDSRADAVVDDHIEQISVPERNFVAPKSAATAIPKARTVSVKAPAATKGSTGGFDPDPALDYEGLLWDYFRMGVPQAWNTTTGSPSVVVGVADTGLDFTHVELKNQVDDVVDFTGMEKPQLCKKLFGFSDQDLAAFTGAPENTDFNGHGSWIGGLIAAETQGKGMSGIATNVSLVSLKISQWCGFAFDSELIAAFAYAADHGIDIVSISFGGYLDRSIHSQDVVYQKYVNVVKYAASKGTTIVAAAGNEHTRIGAGGEVLTHGTLTAPGGEMFDAFGQFETPGGIPGVVDVSSTNNVVNNPSPNCPEGTFEDSFATCKPESDPHQPFGVGTTDQLSYFSNYGPRIDVGAPGGARKFNLPFWDRGGTPGFPYTEDDLTNVWETFSITSNWGVEIPCFKFTHGSGFPQGQCYTAIQGTSMATPHASAALALLLSAKPGLVGRHDAMIAALKKYTHSAINHTPALDPDDTSGGDLTDSSCDTGYCHLGGEAISSEEAYGAGIVDVSKLG